MSLSLISLFALQLFELLADLSEPHGGVGEDLILRYLLLDQLCEDYLERQGQATLLQVLLEHQCLFLSLPDLSLILLTPVLFSLSCNERLLRCR